MEKVPAVISQPRHDTKSTAIPTYVGLVLNVRLRPARAADSSLDSSPTRGRRAATLARAPGLGLGLFLGLAVTVAELVPREE